MHPPSVKAVTAIPASERNLIPNIVSTTERTAAENRPKLRKHSVFLN